MLAVSGCSDAAAPRTPALVERLDGDGQSAYVGNPLPDTLEVRVLDDRGRPLEGVAVTWTVTGGGGAVDPPTTASDRTGRSRARWTLGPEQGEQRARARVDGLEPVLFTATGTVPAGRAFADRADDVSAPQVHVMYVVPQDGTDRALDTGGALARSVASFAAWFRDHTGGLAIRFDTHDGALDITFARLASTDGEIALTGSQVVTRIASELEDAGRLRAGKHYLVYYDGSSDFACGGAAWPPRIPGRTAAMYLRGRPNGGLCPSHFVDSPGGFPGYWEFAALHDLLHTLGIVSEWAPNHTPASPAHVPERRDLMYGGSDGWILDATTTVDVGGDDYFGPAVPVAAVALTGSPFVYEAVATTDPPPRATSPGLDAVSPEELLRLPPHPPFPGG